MKNGDCSPFFVTTFNLKISAFHFQLSYLSLAAYQVCLAALFNVEDRLLTADYDGLATLTAYAEGLALDGKGLTVHT